MVAFLSKSAALLCENFHASSLRGKVWDYQAIMTCEGGIPSHQIVGISSLLFTIGPAMVRDIKMIFRLMNLKVWYCYLKTPVSDPEVKTQVGYKFLTLKFWSTVTNKAR